MEKGNRTPDLDVTDEKYEGPSAHIAALGNGVVKHLKWAFIGILGGTIYALFDRKHAGKAIEYFRDAGTALKVPVAESEGFFAKAKDEVRYTLGGFYHLLFGDKAMADELRIINTTDPKKITWLKSTAMAKEQGFGYFFISHAVGIIPGLGRLAKNSMRVAAENPENSGKFTALTFGGAFGAGGYISGWLAALISGVQHGNSGKRQFQRAKKQIKYLQEDNADLEKINDDLHAKYVKAAAHLDTINAAQEHAALEAAAHSELPATQELHDTLAAQAPTTPTEVQLSEHVHEGKLAEKELAVA